MSNFNLLDSFVENINAYANDPNLIESINKLDSIIATESQEPTNHTENIESINNLDSNNATKSQEPTNQTENLESKDYTITLLWKYYNLGYSGTIELGHIQMKTKEQVEEFENKFLNEGKIELFETSCSKRLNKLETRDFKEKKYQRCKHQFGDGYKENWCGTPQWYWLMIEEPEKQLNVNCKQCNKKCTKGDDLCRLCFDLKHTPGLVQFAKLSEIITGFNIYED